MKGFYSFQFTFEDTFSRNVRNVYVDKMIPHENIFHSDPRHKRFFPLNSLIFKSTGTINGLMAFALCALSLKLSGCTSPSFSLVCSGAWVGEQSLVRHSCLQCESSQQMEVAQLPRVFTG